jgi:hypothetical protein
MMQAWRVESCLYGTDYMALGACCGALLMPLFSRKEKCRLWAPLLIVLCGAWAAIPYTLFKLGFITRLQMSDPLFHLFLFTPFWERIKWPGQGAVGVVILVSLFLYTCLYYIKYARELFAELERLEQHAQQVL